MNFGEFCFTKDVSCQHVMWKKVTLPLQGIFLKFGAIFILLLAAALSVECAPARAVLLNAEPVEAIGVRRIFYGPYQHLSKRKSPKFNSPPSTDYYQPSFPESDSFLIEPGDAVSGQKYSPPLYSWGPSSPTTFNRRTPSVRRLRVPELSSQSQIFSAVDVRPVPFTSSVLMSETFVTEATVTSDYKVVSEVNNPQLGNKQKGDSMLNTHFIRNNFSETNDSRYASFPSDTILKYHPPPYAIPKSTQPPSKGAEYPVHEVPNSKEDDNVRVRSTVSVLFDDGEILLNDAPEITNYNSTETSNPFDEETSSTGVVYPTTETKVTFTPTVNVENENSSIVPAIGSTKQYKFSSGAVAGIVIAVLSCVTILTSSVIYLLYRRYNGQCTSVVESKFNSDNCGYLDDSLRSSVYLNNHIELPKENSEEMTSLDNDSFLNSLETMTIQNYWADSTKNTKV